MAAYLIVTAELLDRERFISEYGIAAGELVEKHGGRYLVRAPGAELLEGRQGKGLSVVISEWPDRDAVLAFWNSAEYARLRKARQGLANVEVVLIEHDPLKSTLLNDP